MRTPDEQAITFTDEDASRIHHPHDDAIIITLLIADYSTRKVLVDNGSLADILYYPAFQQMNLEQEQLRLVHSPLVGFGGMKVQPVGTISLPVVVGAYPQQVTRNVNFLIVDCSSSYNAIIGRPTLNSWKAVTSTYHLSVMFPTEYGVGEVQLRLVHSPLVGFGGIKVQPVGTISLPVVVGAYPQQVTRNVNFLVVDCHHPIML